MAPRINYTHSLPVFGESVSDCGSEWTDADEYSSEYDSDDDYPDDDAPNWNNVYWHDEVGPTKWTVAVVDICPNYILTEARFKDIRSITPSFLRNWRRPSLEIVEHWTITTGKYTDCCVCIIKTMWIRLIQRTWKNAFMRGQTLQGMLSCLKYPPAHPPVAQSLL